jgi:transcription elongation factor GreB
MKNYITSTGFHQLKKELHQLLNVARPELVKVVSWAASNGDRSENGDYIYGKRKLREIDRRIRFLTQRLEASEVVDVAKQNRSRVLFGATVVVLDEEAKEKNYQIVGVDEIDPKVGKVSWVSPIAKALLNRKVGDVVTIESPAGPVELEILEIDYA